MAVTKRVLVRLFLLMKYPEGRKKKKNLFGGVGVEVTSLRYN